MKRYLTLSTASQYAVDQGSSTAGAADAAAADRTGAGDRETGLSEAERARPRLTLASEPVWRHKLILTGTLDHRSAAELEDEIECLCEEGVTTLTLDLRQLSRSSNGSCADRSTAMIKHL